MKLRIEIQNKKILFREITRHDNQSIVVLALLVVAERSGMKTRILWTKTRNFEIQDNEDVDYGGLDRNCKNRLNPRSELNWMDSKRI